MRRRAFYLSLLGGFACLLVACDRGGGEAREAYSDFSSAPYLVIDLSSGPLAEMYPVYSMQQPPEGGWTEAYKTRWLVLRRIPAGTFWMGSPEDQFGRLADETLHEVSLTSDYYIGVFPVTQNQWERVMGTWPAFFENKRYRNARPVENVSYYDIRENPGNQPLERTWPQTTEVGMDSFVGRLRARTGLSRLDLPTEAQWEAAARAGNPGSLINGKPVTHLHRCPNVAEVALYIHSRADDRHHHRSTVRAGTARVGMGVENAWGLFDIHGNVWEWCLDWRDEYPAEPVTDPVGAESGTRRVIRGGSWRSYARSCRFARRSHTLPTHRDKYFGFRLAMTVEAQEQ